MVTEHVGGDPAKPENHNGAEHRFLDDADDGLDTARDHGLDEHSGQPSSELVLQTAHRLAHLIGPAQIQFDRARVGLVEQAGHISLEHHMTAQVRRCIDCRVGVIHPAELHHRDAVAAQQVVGLASGQPAAARHPREEGTDDRARVRHPEVLDLRHCAGWPGSP